MQPMTAEQATEDTGYSFDLPRNVEPIDDEGVEASTVEALAAEPEVDWKARYEEAEKARNGILRDLREERQANRERDQRLEELRQAVLERAAPAVEEVPPPSKDDPVAYLDYRMGGLEQRLDALGTMTLEQRQAAEQRMRQEAEMAQAQRFMAVVKESSERKAKETPDFPEAVQYGTNLLREHLAAQGLDSERIEAAVFLEYASIAAAALRNNQDPATAIYERIKRFGYQPKAATAQPAAASATADAVRKGQQASRSLSNVGGSAKAGGKITYADYLELPESAQRKIALDREKWEQLNRTGEVYL